MKLLRIFFPLKISSEVIWNLNWSGSLSVSSVWRTSLVEIHRFWEAIQDNSNRICVESWFPQTRGNIHVFLTKHYGPLSTPKRIFRDLDVLILSRRFPLAWFSLAVLLSSIAMAPRYPGSVKILLPNFEFFEILRVLDFEFFQQIHHQRNSKP